MSAMEMMLAASHHRAVDGQTVWCRGNIALAHQHFWITPQEQGEEQPLVLLNGLYGLSFDGRLDNRAELLETPGFRLTERPVTDAELVAHAYLKWRTACVDHLLGDFAFVIWDGVEQQLFVARDPLGVRQACFYCDSKCCVVASTISQVLAHPGVRCKLNEATIAEYLVGFTGNQRESHYEDVYFCQPGHCALFSATSHQEWRYWHPNQTHQIRHKDEREYVEEFGALVADAVRARLRFVGKPGIALSGGMDSTTVTAVASQALESQGQQASRGLDTYSYVFNAYPECDERCYIQAMVDRYALNNTQIECDRIAILTGEDIPMFSPDYVLNMGGTYLPWTLLEQMRKDGCRVQLTGGFGDMLYERQRYWAADLLRDGQLARLWSERQSVGNGWDDWYRLAKSTLRPYLPARWLAARRARAFRESWHDTGIAPALVLQSNLEARLTHLDIRQESHRPGVVDQLLVAHWGSYVRLKAIVVDWAARLGIEVWEPFRDRRLVEYALALPAYLQGVPGTTKLVLRRAMASHLPDKILRRRTKTILNPWLVGRFWYDEWHQVRSIFRKAPQIVECGYVRKDWLERRLEMQTRSPGEDGELWRVLILEIWLQKYRTGPSSTGAVPQRSTSAHAC